MEDKKEHNYQQQQQQHQPAAYTEAIKMNDVEGLDDDYEESNDQLQNQQPHDQQLQQPQDQQQQSIQSIATQAAAAMAAAMAAQQLLASAAAICGLDLASLTNFAALAAGPASQTGMSASSGPQTAEQLMAAAVAAASFLSHNHLGVPEDLTINQQQGLAAVLAASSAPSATVGGSPTANGNNGLVGVNNTSFINYHNSSSNSSTPAPVSTPSSSHLYQTSSSTSTSPLGGLMAAAAAASASGAGGLGGNGGPGNMSAAAAANQAILLAQVAAIKQQQQQQQQQLAASTNHLNQHLNSLQLPLTLANSINQNNQLQAQSQNHQQLQHLQQQRQQQQQHNNTNNNHHSQTQSNHHNHHNQNNHHNSHNNNNNHHQNHHNQHSHHNHHHHTTTRHLLGGHHHHSSIQTQQQLLATKGYNPLAVVVGSGQQTEILTPTHLRKAKLMFFYVRYPNSSTLKECFRDVRFNKNNTAQLVKWFSNFREFYYIQMEKFARDAIADERIQCKEDIVVSYDHELINQLNNHYNKNRHIELPEVFRQVVEETLRHFFDSIHTKKDQEQSWKKAIYKLIARLDQEVPEYFKTDSFNEHLE